MARTWRSSVLLAGVLLLAAACGGTDDDDAAPAAAGGWVEGEPAWRASESDEGTAGAAAGDMATEDAAAPEMAASAATVGGEAAPPGDEPAPAPVDAQSLRAGSVDDNDDYAGFLEYLVRIGVFGITTRPFDANGRSIVTVTRLDGGPAAGVDVAVSGPDGPVATLRTTADGTARFLPGLYGVQPGEYRFEAGGASATAASGSDVKLIVDVAAREAPIAVDVLFLLDATGSMGDEIDRLKTTIDSVAAQLDVLPVRPDLRFGMTLYRDEGDTFVTSTYDFTADVGAFRTALGQVVADGGGDYPEALDEGLAEALAVPSWRGPSSTVQLVFLVADAPPQIGRQVPVPYTASLADAVARGIKVFPVASSETDDQAEAVFRQLAAATGARFVFLAGGANGNATGANTDIASTGYEELPLDALVVRLVAEELAALTGTPPELPPPTTVPPTNPPGQ